MFRKQLGIFQFGKVSGTEKLSKCPIFPFCSVIQTLLSGSANRMLNASSLRLFIPSICLMQTSSDMPIPVGFQHKGFINLVHYYLI